MEQTAAGEGGNESEEGSGASCREERGRVQVGPGGGLIPKQNGVGLLVVFFFLFPFKRKEKKRNRIKNKNEAVVAGSPSLGCTAGPWRLGLCDPPRAPLSSCGTPALPRGLFGFLCCHGVAVGTAVGFWHWLVCYSPPSPLPPLCFGFSVQRAEEKRLPLHPGNSLGFSNSGRIEV